jgi:hypothetical protein
MIQPVTHTGSAFIADYNLYEHLAVVMMFDWHCYRVISYLLFIEMEVKPI